MPRNSSGTYSLPSGNPVVSNTLIQSVWANNTCSDIGSAITDSLDRNGRGAMLAALKNIDGTQVAPALTFSSEGTLGIYRVGAGILGIAAGGALILSIASTGLTFSTPLVLPVGSAAAPSLTFAANTNTGIYSSTTNDLSISLNGTQAISFDPGLSIFTGAARVAKDAAGYILLDPTGMTSDYQGALKLLDAGFDISTNSGSRGFTFTTGGTLRTTIAANGNITMASGTLTLTGGQQITFAASGTNNITASNATGTLALQTGGANNRLTIDSAGVTVISGATTFSSTVAHQGLVTMSNNIAIRWLDGAATARSMVNLNASNNFQVGDFNNVLTASTLIYANNSISFNINAANVGTFSSSALTLPSGILISTANSEGLRIRNDAGFLSIYNSAGTTRTGTLIGNTASALNLNAENGAVLNLGVGGTLRFRIDTNGNATIGSALAPSAWSSTNRALEIFAAGNAIAGNSTTMTVCNSLYFNGTNWTYTNNTGGTVYQQVGGAHQWFYAAAGSIGGTVSPTVGFGMDVNGNVMVGTQTPQYNAAGRGLLEVSGSSQAMVALKLGTSGVGYMWYDGTNLNFSNEAGNAINFKTGAGLTRLTITSGGVIQDANSFELGWKDIPFNSQTASYTLVIGDRGKAISITTGGVTVPQSIFSPSNIVTIVNNSGTSQTITQGTGVTMHQAGTTNTGNRTLLAWGIASVLCVGSSVFVISGNIT
jgi:hypothetical protein